MDQAFKIFKGDPAEFGVITAAFYGLRRGEVVGLKWDAIDFEQKTITIRHIQAWLGHSTIGTTANIYTHLDENVSVKTGSGLR